MKTIALRFGEQFSPKCGTIEAHQELINKLGYVWFGKMGSPISDRVINEIMQNKNAKILLIQSGGVNCYWAYVSKIIKDTPPLEEIPAYYRDRFYEVRTWFKITKFELAPKSIKNKCRVISSGELLSITSKRSMSPYFVITT